MTTELIFRILVALYCYQGLQRLRQKIIEFETRMRNGRNCCDTVFNVTETIEDGFRNDLMTEVAYVDLTAAYDEVQHNLLDPIVDRMTKEP